ncbi:MAG: TetR/AcrR family transcriptional regulator [Deltaproteobacteria bacterium]|nr:TetR/AcrR family transcriptional regulator [Deltaproteobacteria bacterium]
MSVWTEMVRDPRPELDKYERFTEKGQKKINEICRAAAMVFYEKGYLSATLADVAQAAGLTKGAIFHYFSTKEELLFLVLYRYTESTLGELMVRLNAFSDPQERIYEYIYLFIMTYKKRQFESRLALNEVVNLPEKYLNIIKEKQREFVKILRSLIEDLLEKKERKPGLITFLTYSLLGMCTWPYRWFNLDGKSSPEELAQVIFKIFMGRLKFLEPGGDRGFSHKVKKLKK